MSEWIDVNERLPDERQQYVIAYGNGLCRSFVRYEPWGYVFGNTGTAGQWGATHWMPFTPPPRKLTKDEALREAAIVVGRVSKMYPFHPAAAELDALLPKLREALG